jgi:hypothetical protein
MSALGGATKVVDRAHPEFVIEELDALRPKPGSSAVSPAWRYGRKRQELCSLSGRRGDSGRKTNSQPAQIEGRLRQTKPGSK